MWGNGRCERAGKRPRCGAIRAARAGRLEPGDRVAREANTPLNPGSRAGQRSIDIIAFVKTDDLYQFLLHQHRRRAVVDVNQHLREYFL